MTTIMNASATMTVDGFGEVEYTISPLNSTGVVSTTMWSIQMKHTESGISVIKSLQGSQYLALAHTLEELKEKVLTNS